MKAKIDFAIGGQAVIEGVMMRSPNHIAIAVRKEDGTIKVKDYPFVSVVQKLRLTKIPIVRGFISFFEMLIIGMKALNYSASESIDDGKEEKMSPLAAALGMVFSLAMALGLALGLFKFLPLYLTETLSLNFGIALNSWLYNIIDGGIKISFFIAYIFLIGKIPDLKRVFQYHGAEHMAVRNYEAKVPLTVENSAKQSRLHPRCGTSFVLIVFVISILVYSLVPLSEHFGIKLVQRIGLLPIIAGLSYEFLRWSAKYENSFLMKMIITPGMWLQLLTTAHPTNEQIEVALAAIKKTLEHEEDPAEAMI